MAAPAQPSSRSALLATRSAIAAALVLAAAIVYARVVGHPFIGFDDPEYVARNERVLRGLSWENVRWALGTLHYSNWHPLTWLSYMLDVSLFGPGPGAMHLVNAALHAANAALVFLVLDRMTAARWRSALVAALFALHPTRVESVAWIAERKDVLSVLFGLLALLAYERHARRPSGRAFALVVLAFAASLASKAMLVTLPFVLLLLDVWPLGRVRVPFVPFDGAQGRLRRRPASRADAQDERAGGEPSIPWSRAVLEKLPLIAMALAAAAVGVVAQARWGSVSDLPLDERLANAAVAYPSYVWKLAWPVELGVLYPYPFDGWPGWRVAASGVFLAVATGGAVALVRRAPWVTVGWLWFAGMLVPVIGIVQLGAQAMADRYTYLSAVGLFVAFAWSIPAPPPRLRPAVAGAASTVLLVLGALAWRQAGLWSDEERLYRHTLAVTGPNSRMNAVLAVFLRSRGRIGEAYEHILEANRIWPGNPPDLVNLGIIAHEAGHPEMADRALRSAVESGPRYVPGWYALADHLRKTGRPAEAIEAFRQVVRVQPGHGVAWSELGIQLHQVGRTEEAAVAFAEAVRIAPSDPLVQRNAGVFHALVGNWPLAMDAFSRADRLKPGDPDVLRRLGLAQAEAGDRAGALRTADRLAPLDPRGAAIVRARAGSLPN